MPEDDTALSSAALDVRQPEDYSTVRLSHWKQLPRSQTRFPRWILSQADHERPPATTPHRHPALHDATGVQSIHHQSSIAYSLVRVASSHAPTQRALSHRWSHHPEYLAPHVLSTGERVLVLRETAFAHLPHVVLHH